MSKCPVFQITDLIGKKWTIVILQEVALNGNIGFNAISKRMYKISPKILSQRIREMEDMGIIKKELLNGKRLIRTKYGLTENGQELYNIVSSIKAWSAKYSEQKLECDKIGCVNCSLY